MGIHYLLSTVFLSRPTSTQKYVSAYLTYLEEVVSLSLVQNPKLTALCCYLKLCRLHSLITMTPPIHQKHKGKLLAFSFSFLSSLEVNQVRIFKLRPYN